MLACETGQAICQIMVPYVIKRLIDEGSNVTGSFQDALIQLKPTMLIFLGLSLGTLIFSRLSGAILVMTGATLRKRVRSTAFKYLQFHSQRFFITNFAGSLANRLNEVSMGVSRTAFTILFDFWPVLITFSTSLYLIFQAHSTIALVLGVWTVFYIVISFALASKCRVYANEFANKRSLVSGKIVDSVTNSLNTKLLPNRTSKENILITILMSRSKPHKNLLVHGIYAMVPIDRNLVFTSFYDCALIVLLGSRQNIHWGFCHDHQFGADVDQSSTGTKSTFPRVF
ncbi:MAG: ABC transporter transmembrane domain-containing protein [Bdellovibrionota bacterium]